MKIVKFVMMALGVIGAVLSLVYKLPAIGFHGLLVLGCCALPVVLGSLGTFALSGMPRWASILSALAFAIAAMKTRQGDDLQNIMVVAAFGFITAVVLAIRPDRPAARQAAVRHG